MGARNAPEMMTNMKNPIFFSFFFVKMIGKAWETHKNTFTVIFDYYPKIWTYLTQNFEILILKIKNFKLKNFIFLKMAIFNNLVLKFKFRLKEGEFEHEWRFFGKIIILFWFRPLLGPLLCVVTLVAFVQGWPDITGGLIYQVVSGNLIRFFWSCIRKVTIFLEN